MTKELRTELERLVDLGTSEDMDTNGRLALRAALIGLDHATAVVERARHFLEVVRGTMAGQGAAAGLLRHAISEWDALTASQRN